MLRLGIIGCGKVTTMFHLKAIGDVDVVEVTTVADPNKKRMEDVKKKVKASQGYLDYRELLSDPDVDAVVVNTPPRFHERMTLEAVRAGRHVLCEKPLALSVEGCRHIQQAQTATGLVIHPVHNYAFTPCLEKGLQLIAAGEIGELTGLQLRFDNNLWSYGSKTDFRLKDDRGIVEDLLPHVLSVVTSFTSAPFNLRGVKGETKRYGVIDNLSVSLDSHEGVNVECHMNWTSLIPTYKVEAHGESGHMEMEMMKAPYKVSVETPTGRRTLDKKGFSKYLDLIRLKHPAFVEQYRHFASIVEGSEEPKFTVEDEVMMLGLMEDVKSRLVETSKS
jgi:predicted dehydrogenase